MTAEFPHNRQSGKGGHFIKGERIIKKREREKEIERDRERERERDREIERERE